MLLFIKLILILSLLSICFQDMKDRKVYWFLFLFVTLCSGYLYYTNTLSELFLTTSLINLGIVGVILGVLALYSKYKLKTSLKNVFGLGDALLFIGLCVAFPITSFIVFFVFSLLFSMFIHFILKHRMKNTFVPLAGYMSLFFSGVYFLHWIGYIPNLYKI